MDAAIFDLHGRILRPPPLHLSPAATALRDDLEALYATVLNPLYPSDPGLWTQARCDRFNAGVDRLVARLRAELPGYTLRDDQPRIAPDPGMAAWLAAHPGHAALD